jgi:hypothetical protein
MRSGFGSRPASNERNLRVIRGFIAATNFPRERVTISRRAALEGFMDAARA